MGDVLRFPSHRARRDTEPWISKRQLAGHLGVSERWIELRMRDSGLPHRKDSPSRLVRFRLSDVEGWMERRAS